jgi:hypothetical protein
MRFPVGFCGSVTKSGVGYQARGFIKLLGVKHILSIRTSKTPLPVPNTEVFELANENVEDQVEAWIRNTGIKAIVYEEIPYSGKIIDTAKKLGVKNYVSANFESGRLSEFDWKNVEAVISKTFHNIRVLQSEPWMTTRFHYLPPFFDEEEFASVEKVPETFEVFGHMMGYGKNPRFGEVSVFNSPMGTGEIIDALSSTRIEPRPLKIFAVPQSIYKKSLLEESARNDYVELHLEEFASPADIIKQAGIFIQPSHVEGFGRTYFETSGCGRPTITVNAPPMNEVCPAWELLVRVKETKLVFLGKEQRAYEYVIPDPIDIASKMDWLSGLSHEQLTALSRKVRNDILARYGFEIVSKLWNDFFERELK